MPSTNVWLTDVVPALGNLLATFMLISPMPAVLRLRATSKLGETNPMPYPLTIYNASGWLAYGLVTSNPYLFPSNFIGFLAGVFFTLTAHAVAPRGTQDRIAFVSMAAAAHFIGMGIIGLFWLTPAAAERMWGVNAIVILMVYYIIPLSSMLEILRKKNAISIYPPLAIGACLNGGLWTVYGVALKDINLWLPNGFGAAIGIVQLVLRLTYGAREESTSPVPGGMGVNMSIVRAASGGLGTASAPRPPKRESPEDHPSAKHPGAKEGRRKSILALLNPYTYLHSHEAQSPSSKPSVSTAPSAVAAATAANSSLERDVEARGGTVSSVSGVSPSLALVATSAAPK